jgi:hypothetical protein
LRLAPVRRAKMRLRASAAAWSLSAAFWMTRVTIKNSRTARIAVPLEPDPAVPEWIRVTPGYARSLFDLDEGSKVLALRGAFYLARHFLPHPRLSWAVGCAETAPQGQPVVTGFKFSMEMPVLLVLENLFARALAGEPAGPGVSGVTAAWEAKT